MFKDFSKRLQRDIKRFVDYRIKRSEELSGGKIKSVPLAVNVISHHMQRYAVWFGGSMLASTVCQFLHLYFVNSFHLSPSFIMCATQSNNMTNMVPAFADTTLFSEPCRKFICMMAFYYVCISYPRFLPI